MQRATGNSPLPSCRDASPTVYRRPARMSHRAPTAPEPSPTSRRRTVPSPKALFSPLGKRSETARHATTSHDTRRNRTIYDQHKASTQEFLMPPPPTVCVRPPKRTSEAADCAKPLPPRLRTVPPPHTSSRPPRQTQKPDDIRRPHTTCDGRRQAATRLSVAQRPADSLHPTGPANDPPHRTAHGKSPEPFRRIDKTNDPRNPTALSPDRVSAVHVSPSPAQNTPARRR